MALLGIEGFDNCDSAGDLALKEGWTEAATTNTTFTTGRDGAGRAIRLANSGRDKFFAIPGSPNVIVMGFAYNIVTSVGGINHDVCGVMVGANQDVTIQINTSNQFVLRRSTTVLETGTYVLPSGWHYLEFKIFIADSGGYCTIRVDGLQVEDFTGYDTKFSTTDDISSVYLDNQGFGCVTEFDDFYVLDTTGSAPYNDFLGDCRIETLFPDAAGDSTQFTPSAGSNFQNVDESPAPDDDTTYNESGTVGHKDLYNIGNLSEAYDTVFAVRPEIFARKTDVGTRTINSVLKSGTTESDGSAKALAETYAYHNGGIITADPDTAAAWGAAGVNAAQVGLEIAS